MVIFKELITKVNITWTAILNRLWKDRRTDDWNPVFKDDVLKPNWREIEEYMLKRKVFYESLKPLQNSAAMFLAPYGTNYRQEIKPLRDMETLMERIKADHSDPDVHVVLKCYLHSWLCLSAVKIRFQKRSAMIAQ